MSGFEPKLAILPDPQRQLWAELTGLPGNFVLYGGTAIALRLGHRASVDFDFFSSRAFSADELCQQVPWIHGAATLQNAPHTLTVSVDRGGPVKVSFFSGLPLARVGVPDVAPDNRVRIASLLDLAATKLKVIQDRAEKRDYADLAAILRHGVALTDGLAAAQAVYGVSFNAAISLKALAYFRDGDLPSLAGELQRFLSVQATQVRDLPLMSPQSLTL